MSRKYLCICPESNIYSVKIVNDLLEFTHQYFKLFIKFVSDSSELTRQENPQRTEFIPLMTGDKIGMGRLVLQKVVYYKRDEDCVCRNHCHLRPFSGIIWNIVT